MTKQSKSGEDSQWYGSQIETKSDPITEDPGGDPRLIRQFWFSFNPEIIGKIKRKEMKSPSHQELFNAHVKQIEITLWGDGLTFDTDFPPRLVVGKKRYKIIVVCKIRQGVILGQDNKISNLIDILKPSV